MKQHVADSMKPGDHGSTFAGNPLVTRAAETVVDIISGAHERTALRTLLSCFRAVLHGYWPGNAACRVSWIFRSIYDPSHVPMLESIVANVDLYHHRGAHGVCWEPAMGNIVVMTCMWRVYSFDSLLLLQSLPSSRVCLTRERGCGQGLQRPSRATSMSRRSGAWDSSPASS